VQGSSVQDIAHGLGIEIPDFELELKRWVKFQKLRNRYIPLNSVTLDLSGIELPQTAAYFSTISISQVEGSVHQSQLWTRIETFEGWRHKYKRESLKNAISILESELFMSLQHFSDVLFKSSAHRPDSERVMKRVTVGKEVPVRKKVVDGTTFFFTDQFVDENQVAPIIRKRIQSEASINSENQHLEINSEKPREAEPIVDIVAQKVDQAIQKQRLLPNTLFYELLDDAMNNLLSEDPRSVRWKSTTRLFAEEVRSIVGNTPYQNFLRGNVHLSDIGWKSRNSSGYNLPFLPHISSLQKHYSSLSIQNTSPNFTEDQHIIKQYQKLIQKNCSNSPLILYNDSTDIVPGVIVHIASGRLFGLVDRLVPICEVDECESIKFGDMVRKANVSLIGSGDNKLFFPISYKLIHSDSKKNFLQSLHALSKQVTPDIIVTDSLASNISAARSESFPLSETYLHPYPGHLSKNLRNALDFFMYYPSQREKLESSVSIQPNHSAVFFVLTSPGTYLFKLKFTKAVKKSSLISIHVLPMKGK
jgi:hypothetical protein